MIEIKRMIPELRISTQFQPLVDTFCTAIRKNINSLHSIYMCGSIPNGTANPYTSDADFTIVLLKEPSAEEKDRINEIVRTIQNDYLIIIKIDAPICTIQEVMETPYDWGFWIKIVSMCVLGEDLSFKIPSLYPSFDLQKTYFEAVMSLVPKNINEAMIARNQNDRGRAQKKALKGIIRGIYSLFIVKENEWQENSDAFIRLITKYLGSDNQIVNKLIEGYNSSAIEQSLFEKISKEGLKFYMTEYNTLKEGNQTKSEVS